MPCNGLPALVDYKRGFDYRCFSNNDCPSESYCDRDYAKCCSESILFKINKLYYKKCLSNFDNKGPQIVPLNPLKCERNSDCIGENVMCISYTCVLVSSCYNSTYGCCDDGHTLAKGPNGENCPKNCDCHPAGRI